jgi:2-aminobenzoate-CoA ligase
VHDVLVENTTIPRDCLVSPELQPDYLRLPGIELGSAENVGHWLADRQCAAGRGANTAAIDAETGRELAFSELAQESDGLARALVAGGLRLGDRVALRCPNVPEMLIVVAGIWKAGGVVVPVSPQAKAEEVRYFLADSGARVLFAWHAGPVGEHVDEGVKGTGVETVVRFARGNVCAAAVASGLVDPGSTELPAAISDMPAVLWHTGGTTGRPKGCYHTHRQFLLAGLSIGRALEVEPGVRFCCAAPVGHALGFIAHTIYTVLHGATPVFVEEFNQPAKLLAAIAEHRVHTFIAIAATWARMLTSLHEESASEPDLASLKRAFAMWQSASSTEVYDEWAARGVELLNNFGSTSFATWVLVPRAGSPVPPGSLGHPAPGYEVRTVTRGEDGELRDVAPGSPGQMAVRGPSGLTYWNRPQLQTRDVVDGWTLQDDLIRLEQDGTATYLGRTDFLISTAGYKVAPVEVEQVLATHPAVREVAVIGAPDPIRQQVVAAYIALRSGVAGDDALIKELQQLVRQRLAPYKYPRRVEFIAALPRDSVGKVRQRVLSEWAAADTAVRTAPVSQ